MACCSSKKATVEAVMPPTLIVAPMAPGMPASPRDIIGGEVVDLTEEWNALCSTIPPPGPSEKLTGEQREKLTNLKSQLLAACRQRLLVAGDKLTLEAASHYDELMMDMDHRMAGYGLGAAAAGKAALLAQGLFTFNKRKEEEALLPADPEDPLNPILLDPAHKTQQVSPSCFETALKHHNLKCAEKLCKDLFE